MSTNILSEYEAHEMKNTCCNALFHIYYGFKSILATNHVYLTENEPAKKVEIENAHSYLINYIPTLKLFFA